VTNSLRGVAMLLACLAAGFLLLPRPGASASDCAGALTAEDKAAIRGILEAYRAAWLKGDAQRVLATFTADAVLLPAHGARPVVGKEAITGYWWPAGAPPSTITRLDITVEGLDGDCAVAYAHGRDDVEWTQEEKGVTVSHGHPGTYLNVFRKTPDGTWRIARHMWDDGDKAR
jgi:uncharacterized protein (TIGR02246 family)